MTKYGIQTTYYNKETKTWETQEETKYFISKEKTVDRVLNLHKKSR